MWQNFTFTENNSEEILLKIKIIEKLEIIAMLHISIGV